MPDRNRDTEWPTREERAAWPDPTTATTPAQAQVGLILRECGEYLEPGPPDWREEGVSYFVRRSFVIVPDAYAERARELLERAGMRTPPAPPPDSAVKPRPRPPGLRLDGDFAYGIRWLKIKPGVSVFDALRVIREGRWKLDESAGVADVEHLVHVADHTSPCPADEPRYVGRRTLPDPPVSADPCAGSGIRVLVIDTGFDKRLDRLPWLRDVRGDRDEGITRNGAKRRIGRYAGHGTFIAGVVRTMAPAADVIVRAGLPARIYTAGQAANPPHQTPAGTAFEGDLAMALERYIHQDNPDVITLSAGTLTESARGATVLEAFYDQVLRLHKGIVIVAAAGNDGKRGPFWPAASRWTVGVGALSANWRRRAQFSNRGAWVDVYAPGEHLTNAFPAGIYTYSEAPNIGGTQLFKGMAVWSGTSFAAPMVAGLIARRMSHTGENGPDAAAALLAQARRDAIPGVGATLLPDDHHPTCHAKPQACSCHHN